MEQILCFRKVELCLFDRLIQLAWTIFMDYSVYLGGIDCL